MSKAAQRARRAGARDLETPVGAAPKKPAALRPPWLTYSILALAAIGVFSRFWFGIGDPDFWWHLKTGQYVWQTHKLPVPDPFAYTTYMHADAYPGEGVVRHFNLTHEWLAQLAFYGVYSLAGAAGIAALRALMLTLICGVIGLVVWRRTGGFYRSIAAALVVASTSTWITGERPYLFTFLILASVIAILEFRRWLWALPPLFLLWANLHGAFFLGWIVLAAYVGPALLGCLGPVLHPGRRALARRAPLPRETLKLLVYSALAVLMSSLNPNGFRIIEILLAYRRSALQTSIAEWQRPKYWELTLFTTLLYGSFAALMWARRRARASDWILYLLFAAAALSAVRNIILIGLIGPIILATYLPIVDPAKFLPRFRALPALLGVATALLLGARVVSTRHPDFDAAQWRTPTGAADFLLAHHIDARLFNSYESGGYLIWRLWPQNRVFIDGRAVSEAAFADYRRIAFNADSSGGPSGDQLIAKYGIDAIVMPMIDYSGKVYLLPAALSDPSQHEWHLVYADPQAVIYLKNLPPGVAPIAPGAAFAAMEAQCNLMLDRAGDDCARGVANLYAKIGDSARAAHWMAIYQSRGGGANAQYEVVH